MCSIIGAVRASAILGADRGGVMAAERSDFAKRVAEMTERLKGLQVMQEQIVEMVREVQSVMLFDGHPEFTALDDELDILYRGQL
jgi:folate-dependent tRNA-U54 methylase TrmFO/GidA